jgi:hypothetical protein
LNLVLKENICSLPAGKVIVKPREMENISRGPIFGDFVTILRGVAGQHGWKITEYKSKESSLPSILNVMYSSTA